MKVQSYKNAKEFLAHAGLYLAKDEARYGLILGIANALVRHAEHYGPEPPWFCSINTGTKVNAVAIRTPPHMVILAYFSGNIEIIIAELVKAVYKKYQNIPGVIGDKEIVDVFAKLWCEKYGVTIKSIMAQRIYRLLKVNNVPLVPGKFRIATMADKELISRWHHAFHVDIGGKERNEPENDITPVLKLGWVFIWEDGQPVSMALKTRPTDKGMTVVGVYTPPEFRGKGYATSCVAEVSRNIMQSGKEFCTLYTDLANPTSNSIYKRIGYQEVADSVEYTFKPT